MTRFCHAAPLNLFTFPSTFLLSRSVIHGRQAYLLLTRCNEFSDCVRVQVLLSLFLFVFFSLLRFLRHVYSESTLPTKDVFCLLFESIPDSNADF